MVYQYYIFEVKRYNNGELEHAVDWAYDEDEGMARLKGEAKWHEKMAAAALSDTDTHSVTLIGVEGQSVKTGCYYHNLSEGQTIDTPSADIIDNTGIVEDGE